jgi:hypothetical protein
MKYLVLVLLAFSLSACSVFERRTDQNDKTVEAPLSESTRDAEVKLRPLSEENKIDDIQPATDGIASPIVGSTEAQEVDVTLNKKSYLDEKYHDPDKQESKTDTIPATDVVRSENVLTAHYDGVEPEKALRWLKNGNKRFVRGHLRADGQSKKDIQRLASQERPHAVIFSSSDSRIPPEIIFDEKLGEIYVIRNLGLTVDNSVLNSIDYAVGQLGTRLVIVLDRSYPGKGIDFSHADQTAQKLADQSQVLTEGLNAKKVMVIPAVYDLESGIVNFGK